MPTERVEMPALQRLALPVAIVVSVLLLPRPAGTETEPCSISVTVPEQPAPIVHVTIPELEAPIVNLTVPDSQPIVNLTLPEQPAPSVTLNTPTQRVEIPVEVERVVEVEVEVETIVHCDAFNSPDRQFAFITDGIVTNVAAGSGPAFQPYLTAVSAQGRETTCVFPKPGIGWTWDGERFAPPQ